MTAPPEQQTAPAETATEDEIAAVLALLAVGGSLAAVAAALGAVLGISAAVTGKLLGELGEAALKPFRRRNEGKPVTAVQLTERANLRYRAAFLVVSLRRLVRGGELAREVTLWRTHVRAQRRRLVMGRRVDEQRWVYGELLGWHATLDRRTSDECRAAHQKNFYALRPPVIGYPGTTHPHCRCRPGAPFDGAKLVDESLTVRRSDAATGFYPRGA